VLAFWQFRANREYYSRKPLDTLSQRRLLHAVSNYLVWKATACLKALRRGRIESPIMEFSETAQLRGVEVSCISKEGRDLRTIPPVA
jgi:hypothetical protein